MFFNRAVKLLRSVYDLFYGLSCEPIAVLLFQIKNDRAVSRVLYRRALMSAPALAIYPGLRSPAASICLPPGENGAGSACPFGLPVYMAFHPVRFTYARSVTAAAVGSYPAFSPLPP